MPKWTPISAEFTGSARALGNALDAGTQAAAGWNKMAGDLLAQERQAGIDAQNKLLFDQGQEERSKILKDREAKQLFAEELVAGPQKSYKDITGQVLKEGLADPTKSVDNLTMFAKDGGGIGSTFEEGKYYGDIGLQTPLSKAQFEDRLARQQKFGGLTEEQVTQGIETQPQMLSRMMETLKAKGYDTSPYVDQLVTARANEITTGKAAKDTERSKLDLLEKELGKLSSKRQEKGLEYNVTPAKIYDVGSSAVTRVDSIKDQENTIKEAKKDAKGSSRGDVLNTLYDQTTNWLSEAADTIGLPSDATAAKDLAGFMLEHEISPKRAEAIGVSGKFYKTTDLSGNLESLKSAMLEDKANNPNAEGYKGGTIQSSSDTSTTTQRQFQQMGGNVDVSGLYGAERGILEKQIKESKERLAKLENPNAAFEGRVKELLTPKVDTPAKTEAKVASVLAAPTTEKKEESKTKGSKAVLLAESIKPKEVTSKSGVKEGAKKEVIPEAKKTVKDLTVKERKVYDSWKKDFGEDGKGLESSSLDPLALLAGSKSLEKIAESAPAVARLLSETSIGRGILKAIGAPAHGPFKGIGAGPKEATSAQAAEALSAAKTAEKLRLKNLEEIAKKTAHRKETMANSQKWADELKARDLRDSVLARPKAAIPQTAKIVNTRAPESIKLLPRVPEVLQVPRGGFNNPRFYNPRSITLK